MNEDNCLDFLDELPAWEPQFPFKVPEGLRLVSYEPVKAPFRASRASMATNANLFIEMTLLDARMRLKNPKTYACPSMKEILGKLRMAGVKMELSSTEQKLLDTQNSKR